MKDRRSILLVLAGIAAGSLITGVVSFLLLRAGVEQRPRDAAGSDTEADGGVAAVVAAGSSLGDGGVEVSLTGKCAIAGRIVDEAGKPVAGATARLRLLNVSWRSADLDLESRSDATGRVRFAGLNESLSYQIWAFAEGRAVADDELAACGEESELVLESGGSLRLEFVDPKGAPAGAVAFELAGSAMWPPRIATTAQNGAVVVTGLEPGDYAIWASARGDLAHVSDAPLEVAAGRETRARIQLAPALSSSVRVVSAEDRRPIANAVVVVEPASMRLLNRVLRAGADGVVQVTGLAPGGYGASAFAPGFVLGESAALRPGGALSIALDRGGTILGAVRTDTGQPVAGASIAVEQVLGGSLVAVPATWGRQFRRQMLTQAAVGWPPLVGSGRKDGAFVPGPPRIPLPRRAPRPASGEEAAPSAWQLTDAAGRFLLDGLPYGDLALLAEHPDFVTARPTEVTVAEGGAPLQVVIAVQRGATAAVRVLNEQGFPVPEAEVFFYDDDDDRIAGAPCGPDGFVRLGGLPGSYRVEATAEGRVPAGARVAGRPGESADLEIVLPAADKTLYGRLIDVRGYGVAGASVTARSTNKGLIHVLTGETANDGSFLLTDAGAGKYHVVADAGKQGKAQVADATSTSEIKLVLGSGGEEPPPLFVTPEMMAAAMAPGGRLPGMPDAGPMITTRIEEDDGLGVTGPPPGKGGLPITLGGGAGKVFVSGIGLGSRLAETGIRKGDRLVAVDGRKVSSPEDARASISGPIGTVVMLEVEHDGERFTAVVQRERVR